MKRKEHIHSEDLNSKRSSSSTSPHTGDYEGRMKRPKENDYEVFLSFRGKDTRTGFTDHLYTRLVDAGIHVFRDDNELCVGEEIRSELLYSITQSKISIPIISEDYASSKWCLWELAHMLKCKRSGGQIVLPIFYKVKPSQLRHLAGRWAYAINAHEKNLDKMVVKEWEEALKEVSSLKGWESEKIDNGHEAMLVKTVVERVMSELKRPFGLNVLEHLVGIDDPVEQIICWIDAKFNCTRIIGIYGMGGIGKTTLARVLYKKLSSHFEHLSFVANIRETSLRKGIECLQKQLIYDILKSSEDVSNVYEGIDVIKSQFTSKKVLVLLDDMDDNTHLNALAGDSSWFKDGSIIIITTRNKSILDNVRANYMYQLNELPSDQSLILFSRHAFGKDSPQSDYEIISHDIVSTTGGLPLALEVIGSFLWKKTKEVWKDTLKKLRKVPDTTVQNKLKISYDALDDEEQQIFLDIACFFVGSPKQNPTYMWDACGFFPGKGIEVLSLMSLIKVDEDGKLMMHDQLRDLGREIVRLENKKKLQKRSRLWICEDVVDVINSNKGTRKIEALCLHGLGKSYTAEQFRELGLGKSYTAEQFRELTNLRYLQANGANFTGNFQNLLSQLRWLEWKHCPLDFAAANFHPKKLVVLNLSCSMISENWEGWGPLKMATELKVLDLTGCRSLRRTPDLSTFQSLEILILEDCENLEEIHPSLGDIKTLISLNVTRCGRLKELPVGVGKMEELRELLLDETAIQEIPMSRGCLVELETLHAQGCSQLAQLRESMGSFLSLGIKELPEFVPSPKELETLDASLCSIARIPSSIGHLASLSFLDLSNCPKLVQLPESIGSLVSLTHLCVFASVIEGLPESIGNLQNLRILDIARSCIRELPSAIGMLAKLQYLNASFCKNLKKLPSSIGKLISLNELDLEFSSISCLPKSISKLSSLRKLHAGYCLDLQELPKLPFRVTILGITCQSPQLPHLSQLALLKILGIYHCNWLDCLPELPVELSTLWIQDCGKLTKLTLSNSKHLSKLILLDCCELTEVTGLEGLKSPYIEVNKCPKLFGI